MPVLFWGLWLARTGRIGEIVRVNDRIVQRVRGVDVDSAVAVRMLERGGDTDVTVGIAVHQQNLDLANRAGEYRGSCRVVDRLVTGNDALVVGRVRRVLVHLSQDALLLTIDITTVEEARVHISNAVVDVREVEGVVLRELEY